MKNKEKNTKQKEIKIRRAEIEKMHIFGFTTSEIAEQLNIDIRTVGRDIEENRKERLQMLTDGDANDVKDWLRNQLADYIAFTDEAKKQFCEQSKSFKTEASRTRALWFAFQIESQKMETIKSLMYSLNDLRTSAYQLDKKYNLYEN